MNDNFYVENGVYIVIPKDYYKIAVLIGSDLSLNSLDDNVDVEVRYSDGRLFTATFFTLQNVKTLFEKNKITGECGGGLYYFCIDMILVESLSVDVIVETVENLIKEGDLESAFILQNAVEEQI